MQRRRADVVNRKNTIVKEHVAVNAAGTQRDAPCSHACLNFHNNDNDTL